MNRINVAVQRLDAELPLPAYAYEGDAGLDLMSAIDVTIQPFERMAIPTGICVAIPAGYAGFIQPRSGLSLKSGLTMINTPGLIDANYRGELKVAAVNLDARQPVSIKRGDRIAQLVIQEVPVVTLTEVASLDATARGANGFGSSRVSL